MIIITDAFKCVQTQPLTPALHLATSCLGVNKRSPAYFCETGPGSCRIFLYSTNYDKEQVGVCTNSRYGCLQVTRFLIRHCRDVRGSSFNKFFLSEDVHIGCWPKSPILEQSLCVSDLKLTLWQNSSFTAYRNVLFLYVCMKETGSCWGLLWLWCRPAVDVSLVLILFNIMWLH